MVLGVNCSSDPSSLSYHQNIFLGKKLENDALLDTLDELANIFYTQPCVSVRNRFILSDGILEVNNMAPTLKIKRVPLVIRHLSTSFVIFQTVKIQNMAKKIEIRTICQAQTEFNEANIL